MDLKKRPDAWAFFSNKMQSLIMLLLGFPCPALCPWRHQWASFCRRLEGWRGERLGYLFPTAACRVPGGLCVFPPEATPLSWGALFCSGRVLFTLWFSQNSVEFLYTYVKSLFIRLSSVLPHFNVPFFLTASWLILKFQLKTWGQIFKTVDMPGIFFKKKFSALFWLHNIWYKI